VETRTAPLIGGRYRIDGLLGEGGMARVFDAFDERLERQAAVKILRAETRALPGMRQRFQQEALIAARLLHPHIVAVLDFGEDHASSYLVMERLPGTTLRDEIVARGPLPPQRVLLVMAETLDALAAAHARGVLHRDIKPSNILLQQDGHTKITDFGIAKSFDIRTDPAPPADDMTMTGVVLGTPGYLSPERRSGSPATVQSDLYAVGAVMVEALTGQRLGPGPAPVERLPPTLRDVASRSMAPDPRDRFASANDMWQSLRTAAGGSGPAPQLGRARHPVATTVATPGRPASRVPGTAILTAPRPERPRERRSRVRRRRVMVAAVLVTALAVALGAVLWSGTQPTGPAAHAAKHHVRTQALTRPDPPPTDTERSAITALATSLADGGQPGDGALAGALQQTAAQAPGPARQASAQQALSLAGVLLDGGGITSGQYQEVVNVLQPTGATTTTTTTTTTVTAPSPPLQTPIFGGHGHGHDRGYEGDQG
jgi:eukaryotic-like serine/threonine-protein kinase